MIKQMYMHISQESLMLYPLYELYIRAELVRPSRVDDTHYGLFRVPVRVNQVCPVDQGLQQVRRLNWNQQEAQSTPDPMESIRPWNKIKNESKAKRTQTETRWKWTRNKIEMKQIGWEWKEISNLWNAWPLK